jgi:hypothetical protein
VSYRTRIDPFTWITHPMLIGTSTSGWAEGLPLALGPANPIRAFLRRLPVVGRVAPRAQTLHWDTLAIYRVQFRALHGNACAACYEAVLLDAA